MLEEESIRPGIGSGGPATFEELLEREIARLGGAPKAAAQPHKPVSAGSMGSAGSSAVPPRTPHRHDEDHELAEFRYVSERACLFNGRT
jgi:hypothetical protein